MIKKLKRKGHRTAALIPPDLFVGSKNLGDSGNSWKNSKNNFGSTTSKNLSNYFQNETTEKDEENQKRWKNSGGNSSTKNASTLSLHIAAYENSIDTSSNETGNSMPKFKDSKILAKSLSSSTKFQDNFEFPRQNEESNSNEPEIMQFAASQTLINPNESASSNTNSEVPPSDSTSNTPNIDQTKTARFNFNGNIKPLQVAALTPTMIVRIFRLEDTSLCLTDDQGNPYMPEGDKFSPALKPNKLYEVHGIESVSSSKETKLALQTMNDDLKVIQGNCHFDLVEGVITNCKDMNESANMLFHGPQAVVMVQRLAILAVCAPDPTLDVETLDPKIKARLADPGSFRASLLHVANEMCSAFRDADTAMKRIRGCLTDLPDYFTRVLEIIGQMDDAKAQKLLCRLTDQIKNSSDTCSKMAASAKQKFDEVILSIDALSVAACSSKTVNDREKEELKKLKKEITIKKEQTEIAKNELEREAKEAQEMAKEALKEYREQMNEETGFGKLFLATFADGVMDAVKLGVHFSPASLVATTVSAAVNSLNSINNEKPKYSNTMNLGAEKGLIQCLEKIGTSLSDPASLNEEILLDYISSLKDFQKYSAATEEGKTAFILAKRVEKFLIKFKNSWIKNGIENSKMKGDLYSIKNSLRNTINSITLAHEQMQKDKAAAYGYRGQLIQAESERIKSAHDHLTVAEVKAEARRKELNESRKELTELICKLQSVDTNTVELTEIIQYLRMGMEYLGKVKRNWERLAEFFGNIQIIVDENLTKNVQIFLQEARDPLSRTLMFQSALKATGYCIQVSNVASIYSAVSGKYIMPIISSIGEELALEPQAARRKHPEIASVFVEMEQGVTELIEKKKREVEDRFQHQMESYGRSMAKSVKVGSIAAAKAIQN